MKPIIHLDRITANGGGIGWNYTAQNFTDLNTVIAPDATDGEFAYVIDSQGTKWLPGTLGGTYYPNGFYIRTGGSWISDRNAISEQLQLNKPIVTNTNPTVNDDASTNKHQVGQIWLNNLTSPMTAWIARDLTIGAAVWERVQLADSNGTLVIEGGLVYGSSETVNLNTNTNNLVVPNIQKTILVRINMTGNNDLTGIIPADSTKATEIVIVNVGTGTIIMKNNDVLSLAQARFLLGGNIIIQANEGIAVIYDPIDERWRSSSKNI